MADSVLTEENLDISKLKVPDLKRELKSRGLSTSGNKTDLTERLQVALKSKQDDTGSAESVDDLDDEDLLNDDDLDHDQLDASESVLTEIDEQLDVSPISANTLKRKVTEEKKLVSDAKPVKKIILNRVSSHSPEFNDDAKNDNNVTDTPTADTGEVSADKKVVKLSKLSAKERLEMRAKKFGAPTSVEARKVARAQRFSTSDSATSSTITTNETPTLDALKKRAERFGGSVSKVISNIELQERLEQRKARFGLVTSTNGTSSQSDKAKLRLERFKTPIK